MVYAVSTAVRTGLAAIMCVCLPNSGLGRRALDLLLVIVSDGLDLRIGI